MSLKALHLDNLGPAEDLESSNAVYLCSHCGKVFLVSVATIQTGDRKCPRCDRPTGFCVEDGVKEAFGNFPA